MNLDSVDLSKVKVGSAAPALVSIGPLLTANESYTWIRRRRNLVGWTYSVASFHDMISNFKRIIAGRPTTPRNNIKFANNVHLKCYIASDEMLIGSFNLTHPSVEDLCVRITDRELIRFMLKQFNKHWKSL